MKNFFMVKMIKAHAKGDTFSWTVKEKDYQRWTMNFLEAVKPAPAVFTRRK